jgi:hypothetical protein
MLTVEQLKTMPPLTIFATGTLFDKPGGLFMTGSARELRWVAERGGGYYDWAIYCHYAEYDVEWIRRHGDKVYSDKHIRMLVECDDEAFKLYRF